MNQTIQKRAHNCYMGEMADMLANIEADLTTLRTEENPNVRHFTQNILKWRLEFIGCSDDEVKQLMNPGSEVVAQTDELAVTPEEEEVWQELETAQRIRQEEKSSCEGKSDEVERRKASDS